MARAGDHLLEPLYDTNFAMVRDLWPNAHSPDIAATEAERSLAGKLLQHVLIGMIDVYDRICVQDDFNWPSSTLPVQGTLIAHQFMSSYERCAYVLKIFGLVLEDATKGGVFHVIVSPANVAEFISGRKHLTREMFAWAPQAFLIYDQQPGWQNLSTTLIQDFISAGLAKHDGKILRWTDNMMPYWLVTSYGYAWEEASDFFMRVCE